MFRDRGRDRAARDALVERYLPLARSLARRYARGSEPLDDLEQVASLALIKAIDAFDSDRGTAFSSFAVPSIVGALKRHYRGRTAPRPDTDDPGSADSRDARPHLTPDDPLLTTTNTPLTRGTVTTHGVVSPHPPRVTATTRRCGGCAPPCRAPVRAIVAAACLGKA